MMLENFNGRKRRKSKTPRLRQQAERIRCAAGNRLTVRTLVNRRQIITALSNPPSSAQRKNAKHINCNNVFRHNFPFVKFRNKPMHNKIMSSGFIQ